MKRNQNFFQVLILLLVLLVGFGFWTSKNGGDDKLTENTKEQLLLNKIGIYLEQMHFSPQAIDDQFSKKVFNEYLSTLDQDKSILIQPDIEALKKHETNLDNEIHGEAINFYSEASAMYMKRLDEVMQLYKEILSGPFEFTAKEEVLLDGDKREFADNVEARKEYWRKKLKFMTLERYVEMLEQRDKNKDDTAWNKTNETFEKEARTKVLTALERVYNRQKQIFTPQEQFNTYVNVIADLMDPHTQYLPPIEKRQFDEEMSGRFYGIGAQLKDEEGAIKISSLVAGSPAWKSGQVQVNDEIIKVAQGKNAPVDVRGYAVTDAVKLIRGNKGTEVAITFKKPDGTLQVVHMLRDEIVLDETFARSAVINNNGKKIGYILLPEFYIDLQRPDGNRASVDVGKEIIKLQKENVEGIILDLRNNGGGSLYEVVQMVGLFIDDGPVVQVKDRNGNPAVLKDNEQGVLYNGPLAVMVNELSASASEIFAAAIQDYKRGVVIGSTSTFGKGTVQKPIPLGKTVDLSGQTEYGYLKLTFEKFYRVNGGSTQLKGVTPDIILPDAYEFIKFREKDLPSALEWDKITKADYDEFISQINWASVIEKANERVSANPAFNGIKKNAEFLEEKTDRRYSLNMEEYKKEQSLIKKTAKLNDTLTRLSQPMNFQPLEADKNKYYNNPDSAKGERNKQWLKNISSDIYIDETTRIINDMALSSMPQVKN